MFMRPRQNNEIFPLGLAVKELVKRLVAGGLRFYGSERADDKLDAKNFTPLFNPGFHRYLELVMLINGSGGLLLNSKTFKLTKHTVWAVMPGVSHSDGCIKSGTPYSLLWVVVLSRGINFHISERVGRKSSTFQRYFLEFAHAKQLWIHGCNSDLSCDVIVQAQFLSHLFTACELAIKELSKPLSALPCNQEKLIQQAKEYIEQHYREQITVSDLAEFAGYTPNYLGALFLKYTGQTIHQYILQVRLRLAMGMLNTGQHQIKEIAYLTGFKDPLYFSRLFSKHYHKSPSDIIESVRGKKQENDHVV
jgi:AraC-like DNA-binding protein